MADAKWFRNLSATTPSLAAARVVLESRARTVDQYVRRVADRPAEDPEDIHQLRVATRRFNAALSIFKGFLWPVDYRQLRRLVRQLRRAAGSVRDLDVHLEMIKARLAARPTGAIVAAWCTNSLLRERRLLERRLVDVVRADGRQFSQAVNRAVDRLGRARGGKASMQPLADLGRKILQKRLKAMRSAGREELRDLDTLHQLRIAAKRLRYAMEVFAGCYPAPLRGPHYRVVERIQDDLGRINDLRNLIRTMRQLQSGTSSGAQNNSHVPVLALNRLQSRLRIERKNRQARFLSRWSDQAQKKFHHRVKKLLNRAATRSRVQDVRSSKL